MGGMLLVTLSVSAAFGAPPAGDASRGQTIASFVHSVVFGQEAPDDDPEDEDEQEEQDDQEEQESDEEESEEEESDEEQSDSRGACVSAVAHDKEGVNDAEGAEYRNHGARVSEAARVSCREADEESEAVPAEDDEQDEEDEESDSHGACVSAVAHDKEGVNDTEGAEYRNHGGRVSEAARFTCRLDAAASGEDEDEDVENSESVEDADGAEESDGDGDDAAAATKPAKAKASGKATAPGQQHAPTNGGSNAAKSQGKAGGRGRR